VITHPAEEVQIQQGIQLAALLKQIADLGRH
jgi:hypothetical protein